MHLKNTSNCYIESLPDGMFDKIPKSVWAAIAISSLTCGGDQLSHAQKRIMDEWLALFENNIVTQKPMKLNSHNGK